MRKALILGGTGFIGSKLAYILRNNNYEVEILTQGYTQSNLGKEFKVTTIKYNFENFFRLKKLCDFNSIFILNGNSHPKNSIDNPNLDIDLQLKTLISLLETLRKIKYRGTIWFGSSVAVYGKNEGALSEDTIPSPISPYGLSKLACEKYCNYYADIHNLKIGVLRIFSTYGPDLKRQVIYDLYKKIILNPASISLLSKKTDSRDMSYVLDVSNAIHYLDKNVIPNGDIYNIGSGKDYLIHDIALMMGEILGYRGDFKFANKNQSFDGKSWRADNKKLLSIGFNYSYDLKTGLIETIKHWQNK